MGQRSPAISAAKCPSNSSSCDYRVGLFGNQKRVSHAPRPLPVSGEVALGPAECEAPLPFCSSIPRHLTSLRSSSTKNVLTTTWSCTTGLTTRPPSLAASAAARNRTPWWLRAAACFSGSIQMRLCRGKASRQLTAQVQPAWTHGARPRWPPRQGDKHLSC